MMYPDFFTTNRINDSSYYKSILRRYPFILKKSCLYKYCTYNNIITDLQSELDSESKINLLCGENVDDNDNENNSVNMLNTDNCLTLVKIYKILMINNIHVMDIFNTINKDSCDYHLVEYECLVISAIYENRYDILEIVSANGFDFNKPLFDSYDDQVSIDIINIIIEEGNVDMINFLLNKNLDINLYLKPDRIKIPTSITKVIFEQILTLDLDSDSIFSLFIIGCNYMNEYYINFIINKGLDIKQLSDTHVDKLCFSYLTMNNNPAIIIYLINNGLSLSDNLLIFATKQKNNDIISILLENGLSFNKNVTSTILQYANLPTIFNMLTYPCDLSWIESEEHPVFNTMRIHNLNSNAIFTHIFKQIDIQSNTYTNMLYYM